MERQFGQQWCHKNEDRSRKNVSWLTVMVMMTLSFLFWFLVTQFTRLRLRSYQKMRVKIHKTPLQSVGWETLLVEEMDCSWMDSKFGGDRNSGLFGRPLGLRIKTLKISRVDLGRV